LSSTRYKPYGGNGIDTVDRLRKLEEEIQALKAAFAQTREELGALRDEFDAHRHPVEQILGQRGLPILARGDFAQVLIPSDLPAPLKARFFGLMQRYSFRLFLRDLIQFPEGEHPRVLSRYCSLRTVRSYLKNLSDLGIVELPKEDGYRLVPKGVPSFGPTLEWYVCEIFMREFMAPALFNVRLRNTRHGGDYDVVALVSGYLVYVEVKSSPPRGVEIQSVAAFLNRLDDLNPHVAVFLVDTELRMKDKIVPLFEEAIVQSGKVPDDRPVQRLVGEIFHVRHGIYLINSRKGIYSNLRTCFRDFLVWQKGATGSVRL
jgi:hypothetical protein